MSDELTFNTDDNDDASESPIELSIHLNEKTLFANMCENIIQNKAAGIYNGGYEVVKLAMAMKQPKE